ncbi:MAG: N-acetylornithine carbamoyltransferase [Ignavibacteriae bacterium]|nr:N-acetylornithine carbamoyltransferase [Ignavibacteriota bacterium]
MKNFTKVSDIPSISTMVRKALELKANPFAHSALGKNKTLGLIFMNPSLRTRLSSQKAAMNLGMNAMVMNIDKEGWSLELNDGAVMNGTTVEHIKDAAGAMGCYCDIIGIRCFPSLMNREDDYSEKVLSQFIKYSPVPVMSLESATRHPLQSLADMITIEEHLKQSKPKIVLTWAPHVKALPQAVSNSFAEWSIASKYETVITHPEGYELSEEFTKGATIEHDQQKALEGADFVYVKNWSSYKDYGKILTQDEKWLLTNDKLKNTNNANIMHCLPVRRNVELSDEVLDSPNSLIMQQAENRIYAAQAVLKEILESNRNK